MNRKVVWHFVTEQMHGQRKRNTLNRLFKRLKIQRINDHIWLLNDHDEGTGYLVTGTDKALVIDTMYGQEDLKEAVKTLTDLPLMLVNTHGHFDHTYGNLYFDKAYIHPADIGIAEAYFKRCKFNVLYFYSIFPYIHAWLLNILPRSLLVYQGIREQFLYRVPHIRMRTQRRPH